jgi:hypothetical protein
LKRNELLPFVLLLVFLVVSAPSLQAQNPQGFIDSIVWSNAQRVADVMRGYHKKNKKFPQNIVEQDRALIQIYKEVAGSSPDSGQQITSDGEYRALGNLRIATNAIIRNAPLQQWRRMPPENWRAPAGSIVVITDGQSQFLIWCASANSVPIRDSNNLCMFIFDNLEPAEELFLGAYQARITAR